MELKEVLGMCLADADLSPSLSVDVSSFQSPGMTISEILKKSIPLVIAISKGCHEGRRQGFEVLVFWQGVTKLFPLDDVPSKALPLG
jgi:hypothetical protein